MLDEYIVPAAVSHAVELAPRLRKADIDELKASTGGDPLELLVEAVLYPGALSRAFLDPADGSVAGMFGVAPVDEKAGSVWLVSTYAVERYPLRFLRRCKRFLPKLHAYRPLLFNYVDARNTVHLTWLKWLGFSFVALHEHFGVERRPFYEIVRLEDNV